MRSWSPARKATMVKMPLLPADSNRVERTVEAQMDGEGRLKAHMLTQYFGQPGSAMRYAARHESADELKRSLERSFSRRLGGVTLERSAHPIMRRTDS